MGLNDTATAERLHIGFFGLRNAGKSSVVNAVCEQALSIVSDIKGTTTDPVQKNMELLPIGPVTIIDTPGLDDEGTLGNFRKERAYKTLDKVHIALLIVDSTLGITSDDEDIISLFKDKKIPYLIAYNKCDLLKNFKELKDNEIYVSAKNNTNIYELKEKIAKLYKENKREKGLLDGVVKSGDLVVLVTPIDESAPKGRIILPQQQTIRALLDLNASCVVTKEVDLEKTLKMLSKKPDLVITDSKVFGYVGKIVDKDVPLTSFSILFARYKGNLTQVVLGAKKLKNLKDGDNVLISEGCTHHTQCQDIGTVKMPEWINNYTKKKLNYFFTSGGEFPDSLEKYALVVHCGGCMLNDKEMGSRLKKAQDKFVDITNYGIAIAGMHGILKRSVAPFEELKDIAEDL